MDVIELKATDLAAMLCSRVCHDLINPIGAIGNGLEVLDDPNQAEMASGARDKLQDVVSYFRELPGKILAALKEAAQRIKEEFQNMIATAKQSGRHFIDGFVEGLKERLQKVVDAVKKVANTVKDFLGFTRP